MCERVIKAGLIAGDAGVDLIGGVLRRPCAPSRGRFSNGRAIEISCTVRLGEDLLGGLGHVDPVGGDHRDPTCSASALLVPTNAPPGTEVTMVRHPRLVPADPGIQNRGPGCLDLGCQGDDFIPGLAVLDADSRPPKSGRRG